LTLPPGPLRCDCLRMRVAAMPCRRNSPRSACSFCATVRPLTFWPLRSRPSQLKETSRWMERIAVLAWAIVFLLDRYAVDFRDAGHARLDLLEPGAAQIPHAFLAGLVGDVNGIAAGHDDAPDRFADLHDLVETDASLV